MTQKYIYIAQHTILKKYTIREASWCFWVTDVKCMDGNTQRGGLPLVDRFGERLEHFCLNALKYRV